MKKRDLWIIIGIVVFGLVISYFSKQMTDTGKEVRITIDNEVADVLDLDKDTTKTYQTAEGENTLVIKDGEVSITEADCKNQICVHHGVIDPSNLDDLLLDHWIVCLPNGVSVEVTGAEDGQ